MEVASGRSKPVLGWRLGAFFAARWRSILFACGILFGAYLLIRIVVAAFGGPTSLLEYSSELAHKFTARAIMSGTLRMRNSLLGAEHDEQIYNGATFTNWGYGVPLLQIPFHAIAPILGFGRYFPDRLIAVVYIFVLIVVLWTSLRRALIRRAHGIAPWIFSWCVTLAILSQSLFTLLSYRFIQYEEAIAYLVIAELFALSFYLRSLDSTRKSWIVATGAAAGVALLARPTGSMYVLLWGGMIASRGWLDSGWRGAWTKGLWYACGLGPLLAFWFYANTVKTGQLFGLGYANTIPWWSAQHVATRFGSYCAETPSGFLHTAHVMFDSFFIQIEDIPPDLAACHFMYETREMHGNVPAIITDHNPFFSPYLFLLLVGSFVFYAVRRARDLSLYLPHLAFGALFLLFVRAGMGFTYRYAYDFWPILVLVAVQLVRHLDVGERRLGRNLLAIVLTFDVFVRFELDTKPQLRPLLMSPSRLQQLDEEWEKRQQAEQPQLPPRFTCGDSLQTAWLVENGLGLGPKCDVSTFTNMYLGVPLKGGNTYTLSFAVDHPMAPELRVYLNGRVYRAHLEGDRYVTPVSLDYRRLYTPVVALTIEWTREAFPPSARLLSIELS